MHGVRLYLKGVNNMVATRLDDLIQRALQSENDKYKATKIILDDNTIIIATKKSLNTLNSALEIENGLESEIKLIYDHCDILHDKKLHEAYGIKDPLDIVEKVFNSNAAAIEKATKAIMKMYGYFREQNEPNIVDELKN